MKKYYTTSDITKITDIIEHEVYELNNYSIEDINSWKKKYNFDDDDYAIWVTDKPYIAIRYQYPAELWDDIEFLKKEAIKRSDVITEFNENDGVIIKESDDGDDGVIMLLKTVNEKIDTHYEYGCLMAYVKPFKQISINKDDIYDNEENQFGIETNPHITLLYGLHDDEIDEEFVINLFQMIEINDISFENISLFKKDDYEVVKYDIISNDLFTLNKMISSLFPYTNEYDYHPHLTIAYVKPGSGVNYIKNYKTPKKIKFESFVYSMANGKKIKITKNGVEVLREAL